MYLYTIDRASDVKLEEKVNESVDHFAPNYGEMIQTVISATSNHCNSGLLNYDMPLQPAISVQEIVPVELSIQIDQGTSCIIEEYEEDESRHVKPVSRHGAVTICEMYSSKDSGNDLKQNNVNPHKYVSPAITSKPFYLKPNGKVIKKRLVRSMSAGRIKTPQRHEPHQIIVNKQQNSKLSSAKVRRNQGLSLHQNANQSPPSIISNQSSGQSNTNHVSARPASNNVSSTNRAQMLVRQAWKPRASYKELSAFFLAGVNEDKDCLQHEEVRLLILLIPICH